MPKRKREETEGLDYPFRTRKLPELDAFYEAALLGFKKIKEGEELEDAQKLLLLQYSIIRDIAFLQVANVHIESADLRKKVEKCYEVVNYFEPDALKMEFCAQAKPGLFKYAKRQNLIDSFSFLEKFVLIEHRLKPKSKNSPNK